MFFSSFKPNDVLWIEGVKFDRSRYLFAIGSICAAVVIYGGFAVATGF